MTEKEMITRAFSMFNRVEVNFEHQKNEDGEEISFLDYLVIRESDKEPWTLFYLEDYYESTCGNVCEGVELLTHNDFFRIAEKASRDFYNKWIYMNFQALFEERQR